MYPTAGLNSRKKGPPARPGDRLSAVAIDGVRLLAAAVFVAISVSACAPPESPARTELRSRLAQPAQLSADELDRLCAEIEKSIEGKTVRITDAGGSPVQGAEPQAEVLSVLRNRTGLFDEGLRREGEATYRILNGPGQSDNAEVEASPAAVDRCRYPAAPPLRVQLRVPGLRRLRLRGGN